MTRRRNGTGSFPAGLSAAPGPPAGPPSPAAGGIFFLALAPCRRPPRACPSRSERRGLAGGAAEGLSARSPGPEGAGRPSPFVLRAPFPTPGSGRLPERGGRAAGPPRPALLGGARHFTGEPGRDSRARGLKGRPARCLPIPLAYTTVREKFPLSHWLIQESAHP